MMTVDPPTTTDPRTEQCVNPQQIVTSFFFGASFAQLTACFKLPFPAIYKILQDHIRRLVPQLEQTIAVKDQEIQWANESLQQAEAEIMDLRAAIRVKDEEMSAINVKEQENECINERLQHAEAEIMDLRTAIRAKDEEMSAWINTVGERENCIDQMRRELAGEARRLHKQIEDLSSANEEYKHKELQQESEIQTLATQLAMRQWPYYLLEIEIPLTDEPQTDQKQDLVRVATKEKQVLDMFCQTDDLSTVCDATEATPEEIFRILRRRFRLPDQGFLAGIDLPKNWQVDRQKLAETVRESSFLFSLAVVDSSFGCRTIRDLVTLLGIAFDDFSQFPERNWQFMAAFVVEMIAKSVVRIPPTAVNLESQITALKSLRGSLTRKFRTVKADHEREKSELRMEIRDLRRQLSQRQASGWQATGPCETDLPPILREMNEVLARKGVRRYSDQMYYAAVVVLFRSRSTFEFLRDLGFPFPAPNSVYEHFRPRLTASLARLKSADQVDPYLSSLIEQHPEIAAGATLAVDAVACSSTFIGIKNIQRGDIHYLFVVLLEPLVPTAKCYPLFVIESSQGIGNDEIQAQIDQIIGITQTRIHRVFLGSDGDKSYNERNHSFMGFWEPFYKEFGLERVLDELKAYPLVFPVSDLLHLAKNFRIRFLLYLLTFVFGDTSTTINHEKYLDIVGRGPAFTDMSPLGKMRDAYPLAMARLENIVALIDHDAIAEAVALLPLSLTLNAIRLETIPSTTRTNLLTISFFLVRDLFESKANGTDTNPETTPSGQDLPITIFLSQWSERFMDTVLDLIVCIDEYPDLALDRVSTHPLETFFGVMRQDANDVNTPDELEHTIAHTDIVNEAYRDLGLTTKVRNRISVGGVRIGDSAPPAKIFNVPWPENLTPNVIADICLRAVHMRPDAPAGLLSDEEQVWFWQFVQYLRDLAKAAEASATNNEINQRFISGSGSKIRTHQVCT
jgi:hypothetical protein